MAIKEVGITPANPVDVIRKTDLDTAIAAVVAASTSRAFAFFSG